MPQQTRRVHALDVFAASLSAALLACQPAPNERADSTQMPTAYGFETGTTTELPRVRVRSYTSRGTLCPEGSGHWETSLGGAYSYNLDNVLETADSLHGTCALETTVEIPAGYQFRRPNIGYRTLAKGVVTLATRTSIDGVGAGDTPSRVLPETDVLSAETTENLGENWSQTCADPSQPSIVRIRNELDVNKEAYAGFDVVVSVSLNYEGRTEWRRCKDGGSVVATAAGEGSACSLNPSYPCGRGLACELQEARHPNEGSCVNPDQRLPPQQGGQACGGRRNITCDDGFVCAYDYPEHRALHVRGQCRAIVANEGERCDGDPSIRCANGFVCAKEFTNDAPDMRCYAAKTGLNARCGDGFPLCETGTFCDASQTCQQIFVNPGDSCAPELKVECLKAYLCDPATLTCVERDVPARRPFGSRCTKSAECEAPLVCWSNYCQKHSISGVNGPCKFTNDCEEGLMCSADQRCIQPGTKELGAACSASDECVPAADCIEGKCRFPHGDGRIGAFCYTDFDCLGGLGCELRSCVVPDPASQHVRAVCEADSDCAEQFYCGEDLYCALRTT